MLTRTARTSGVGEQDLERRRDLRLRRAAAHVEEVGRTAAGELDHVHRGHRQAGAVHHAGDVAVERDVGQVVLLGLELARLLLVRIPSSASSGWRWRALSSSSILASSATSAPSAVTTSGFTSTSDASVAVYAWYSAGGELDEPAHELAPESQPEGEAARLVRLEAGERIDHRPQDLLRVLRCATSSISTPPSVDAMRVTRPLSRSSVMPR